MTIKYGWYPFHLDLADVKLGSRVELQQRDEDGDWSERTSSWLLFGADICDDDKHKQEVEAWEKNENLRYTKPVRTLSAVANFSSGRIFLGVPEDKNNVYPEEGGVSSFKFTLREHDGEVTTYNQGSMGYSEGDDEYPGTAEKAYLEYWITPDAMDSIEKMIGSDNMKFDASVVLKCWHWTDHSSKPHLYLSKDHSERVQFGSITALRFFPDQNTNLVEDDPDYDEDRIALENISINVYNKLNSIDLRLKDTYTLVIWGVIFGVVVLGIGSYLS
jgi:hypothetical protein